jgi:hypothetical protein
MICKHLRLKRLVLGTAVGLAIAAISAPAVLAKPISGNGPLDPWAYSLVHQPTDGNGPLDPWAYSVIHRDTQSTVTPQSYSAVSGPLGVRGYQSFAGITPRQSVTVTSQSGFNWGDAGIGASVAFGALLLLLTVVALGRRYGPRISRSGFATS